MAARAAGPQPQRAVPRARHAGARAVRRAAAAPDARRAGRPDRGPERRRGRCSSSRAATRSRTSRSPTSPRARSGRSSTAPSTPSSARPPGSRSSAATRHAARGAWQHVALPDARGDPAGKVALAWRAMDAFYEEDDRILGHAADPYHRIDIRHTSRHLVVRAGDRVVADTTSPLVLYESGFAPRWYVPRDDVVAEALTPGGPADVLPVQGHRLLLRHRRRRARRVVVSRAVRRHGGDRRPRVLRARPRRGHAGRRAARSSSPARPSSRTASTAT